MRGEHQQPQEPRHPHQAEGDDIDPKIYVASLSDYNNGHLHGSWIEAAQDADEIHSSIHSMLDKSPQPDAEEYAIHDYEGFAAFTVGEYEDIGLVALVAAGIVEHGRSFSHWVNVVGTQDTERLHRFDEHYRGVWSSLAEYAEDLLDDMGTTVESFTPGWLQAYVSIDYSSLGNDLSADLETGRDPDGTIHIFDPEA